jgi:hypothetical protein
MLLVPNSNTTQGEERIPLQKTQLHQHVTLNITSQHFEDTEGVQGTKGLDNKRQVAKDKKSNPNQWEFYLTEFKFCEDTRPDPQLQKAKAQHSVLISNLHRQGYFFFFGGGCYTVLSKGLTE